MKLMSAAAGVVVLALTLLMISGCAGVSSAPVATSPADVPKAAPPATPAALRLRERPFGTLRAGPSGVEGRYRQQDGHERGGRAPHCCLGRPFESDR